MQDSNQNELSPDQNNNLNTAQDNPIPAATSTNKPAKINIRIPAIPVGKTIQKAFNPKFLIIFAIFLAVFALGGTASYFYFNKSKPVVLGETSKQEKYLSFLLDIFDTVKLNYWNTISDADLAKLYQLGTEKLTSRLQQKEIKNKDDIKAMYNEVTREMDDKKKLEYAKQLGILVLANLQPFNRSGLFSKKEEEALKNRVSNVDPNTNLYDKLGVSKDASSEDIKKAFDGQTNKLSEVLNNNSSTTEQKQQAQLELQQVNRAFDTLSVPEKKTTYDTTKVEATAVDKILRPNIFYLRIKQESPQTFDEFQKSLATVQGKEGLDTLIIDLRDNFGGAIDILPYFLGPFIGQNQYAYEFFHQGEYMPYKTRTGFIPSLYQYKKVVVLINGGVQSSGEVMAATFKKYRVGVLVGEKTKGWGSVERVFPIKDQIEDGQTYSMLLVHSLTLRDDNQPIEGKGVEPDINIKDSGWEKQLLTYFNSQEIVDAVKDIYKSN